MVAAARPPVIAVTAPGGRPRHSATVTGPTEVPAMEILARLLLALGPALAMGLGVASPVAAAGVQLVDYWYGPSYVYPYPYGPPVYVPAPVYAPPPVYVAPPVYVVPLGPAPAQSWYYCDNPPGYYPNVPSCNTSWRQVPATPPR
jgi:hypothetical protein